MLLHVREYHRPHELPEALALLARPGIQTAPLAGGTTLVGEGSPEVEALVDLQDLGLDHWYQDPAGLYLGAMVRLETLVQAVGSYLPPMARAIGQAARNPMSDGTGIGEELWLLADTARELASPNLRNQATLGGVLASAPGNWLLLGALVALDAVVEAYNPSSSVVPQVPIQDHPARPALPNSQSLADPRTGAISNLQSLISNSQRLPIEDYLAQRATFAAQRLLVTEVHVPALLAGTAVAWEKVARTPADTPIVGAIAVVSVEQGQAQHVRLAFTGVADRPLRARSAESLLLAQPWSEAGIDQAAEQAYEEIATPPEDYLASVEYRRAMVRVLAGRVLRRVAGGKG